MNGPKGVVCVCVLGACVLAGNALTVVCCVSVCLLLSAVLFVSRLPAVLKARRAVWCCGRPAQPVTHPGTRRLRAAAAGLGTACTTGGRHGGQLPCVLSAAAAAADGGAGGAECCWPCHHHLF